MEVRREEVERALGRAVSSYEVEPIDPQLRIHSITGGVVRVRTDIGTCVLKVVRRSGEATADGLWGGDDDVSGRNYWKREWEAFATGLLDDLPGRLRAPRTIRTEQRGDGECWIWMEDVDGRTGATLTDDDYRTIGYDLGTTQGSFASGATSLRDDEWLSRRWLRGWVGACRGLLAHLDEPAEPVRSLRERVLALWERREELLRIVETAPQTLVHCDFWPMNLIVDDTPTTYAIDWSQVGLGAVAQDVDQVTLDPVWMQVRPGGSVEELEELVLPSYVEGLRASSLRIEPWFGPSPCWSSVSCSGSFTGSSRNSTWSMKVKMAVFAPIPKASEAMATVAKTGLLRSVLSEKRRSCSRVRMSV